jgi:hypothetical protein
MTYSKFNWLDASWRSAEQFNHLETQYSAMKSLSDSHIHDTQFYTKTESDAKYFHSGHMGLGSGFDADTLDGYHAAALVGSGFPLGSIVIWSADIGTIPSGWVICNGQTSNGYLTPDLRDRFVVGAGGTYGPGSAGGSTTFLPTATMTLDGHALTLTELPSHKHTWVDYGVSMICRAGSGGSNCTVIAYSQESSSSVGLGEEHTHDGSTWTRTSGVVSTLPLYHSRYFIMKTGA